MKNPDPYKPKTTTLVGFVLATLVMAVTYRTVASLGIPFAVAGKISFNPDDALHMIKKDGTKFIDLARMADERGIAYMIDNTDQHPGYPVLMLFAKRYFESWEIAGKTVSIVFGLLLFVPLLLIARRLFSGRAALAAFFLAAFHLELVDLTAEPISEATYFFFFTFAVFFALRFIDTARYRDAGLVGLSASLAYLVRPEAAFLLPLLFGLAAAARMLRLVLPQKLRYETAFDRRRIVVGALVAATLFVLPALPYMRAIGDVSKKKPVIHLVMKQIEAMRRKREEKPTEPAAVAPLAAPPAVNSAGFANASVARDVYREDQLERLDRYGRGFFESFFSSEGTFNAFTNAVQPHLVLLLGFAVFFRKREKWRPLPELYCLGVFAFVWILCELRRSDFSYLEHRHFAVMLPIVIVYAGVGLYEFSDRLRRIGSRFFGKKGSPFVPDDRLAPIVALLLLTGIVYNAHRTVRDDTMKAGRKAAGLWLAKRVKADGADNPDEYVKIVTTMPRVNFYMGHTEDQFEMIESRHNTALEIRRKLDRNVSYLVVSNADIASDPVGFALLVQDFDLKEVKVFPERYRYSLRDLWDEKRLRRRAEKVFERLDNLREDAVRIYKIPSDLKFSDTNGYRDAAKFIASLQKDADRRLRVLSSGRDIKSYLAPAAAGFVDCLAMRFAVLDEIERRLKEGDYDLALIATDHIPCEKLDDFARLTVRHGLASVAQFRQNENYGYDNLVLYAVGRKKRD